MSGNNSFTQAVEIRWSDLDPNYHVRHSVYYDMGAFIRINFLNAHKLTSEYMSSHDFGPILFREECVFRRELRLGDIVTIDLTLIKAKPDISRWSIQHILKRNNELAATLSVDGAWIDTKKRKLTIPPTLVHDTFSLMPRPGGFEWLK